MPESLSGSERFDGALTGMIAGALIFAPLGAAPLGAAIYGGLGALVGAERIIEGAADSVSVGADLHGPPSDYSSY